MNQQPVMERVELPLDPLQRPIALLQEIRKRIPQSRIAIAGQTQPVVDPHQLLQLTVENVAGLAQEVVNLRALVNVLCGILVEDPHLAQRFEEAGIGMVARPGAGEATEEGA